MKIRMHRGGLEESMATVKEIGPRIKEVVAYLKENGIECTEEQIKVSKYSYDERIDWHTFIVTVDGNGVAFTDDRLATID